MLRIKTVLLDSISHIVFYSDGDDDLYDLIVYRCALQLRSENDLDFNF